MHAMQPTVRRFCPDKLGTKNVKMWKETADGFLEFELQGDPNTANDGDLCESVTIKVRKQYFLSVIM
jgi:hypothetical protein